MSMIFVNPNTGERCTCGPYWSVVPPPPCPVHSYIAPRYIPQTAAGATFDLKDTAETLRRLADMLDPKGGA